MSGHFEREGRPGGSETFLPGIEFHPTDARFPTVLYPPIVDVEPRWLPIPGEVDRVYSALFLEKPDVTRRAPLSRALLGAVQNGLEEIANLGLLRELGGWPQRLHHCVGVVHPYDMASVSSLWIQGPKLFGDDPVISPATEALARIQEVAGNREFYFYPRPRSWEHGVEIIANKISATLRRGYVSYTQSESGGDVTFVIAKEAIPMIFPYWTGWVNIYDGDVLQQVVVTYEPSFQSAGVHIEIARRHPDDNLKMEQIVTTTKLVDAQGHPIAYGSSVFASRYPTSDREMRKNLRFGYTNARQSRLGIVWLGQTLIISAPELPCQFDALPIDLPDDPSLYYSVLFRMMASILSTTHELDPGIVEQHIQTLARQILPHTNRLIDGLIRCGSVPNHSVIEGFMQIIRATIQQPRAFSLLATILRLDRIFPRAGEAMAKLVRDVPFGEVGMGIMTDGIYTNGTISPNLIVDRNAGYTVVGPDGIRDFASFSRKYVDQILPVSPIAALADLWQPFA